MQDTVFFRSIDQGCKEQGITRRDLEEKAHLMTGYIDQLEQGKIGISPGTIEQLADILDLRGRRRGDLFESAGFHVKEQKERRFAQVLRQFREERFMTESELETKAGLQSGAIAHITAMSRPYYAPVGMIATALGLQSEQLTLFVHVANISERGPEPNLHYFQLTRLSSNSFGSDDATMRTISQQKSVNIFYSYAHQDKELRDELDRHLSILKQQNLIMGWYDRDIQAGTNWEQEIHSKLEAAHIILLLISSDFLSSPYCYSMEMSKALQLHREGKACVIPIIMRPVHWHLAPFAFLQVLPTGAKPVASSQWHNRDEALNDVAEGIATVVQQLLQGKGRSRE